MKYITLILLFFAVPASSQTIYLKVVDKPDYSRYVSWCKDSVLIDVFQYGKATVVNQNISGIDYQLYKAIYGRYSDKLLKDTFWYQLWHRGVKTTAISLTSDQILLVKKVKIKTQRYEPSVKHYYLIRDKYKVEWNIKE